MLLKSVKGYSKFSILIVAVIATMFPEGYFYIEFCDRGFVLDVYDGQQKEGANIIIWPQKFEQSDNQLWIYKDNRFENKKSGLGIFKKDKTIIQKKADQTKKSQEWIFDQGFLCSKEYPDLVMDVKGDVVKGGAQVILRERSLDDGGLSQRWNFESYKKIEQGLDMASSSTPLHKKEGFGVPRGGYGAEIGCPPELTSLPENSPVVCDTDPTPTAGHQSASLDDYDPCELPTKSSQLPPPLPQNRPVPPSNNNQFLTS
ncbi:carbohydrate-binding module family 13 protein [Backusella circina FSU 941]|nr:carbohydrate-binding module family 13 protein [Backusella circina FSU 941]